MLVSQKRPRDLGWLHAGPLLFGDWGTSRLYVLGLAFYFVGHAAPYYLAAMSLVLIAVAWAYTVVCRCFPDGGGVYAAARQLSPTLSVIGATLLLAGYLVTAAISMVEALRYIGLDNPGPIVVCSAVCIGLVGVINWFGSKSAGRFALIVAIAAIAVSALVAIMVLPNLAEGIRSTTTGDPSVSSPGDRWVSLVRIILALSGVEAVANMTGLMKEPVARTAKRTIWPVLGEVVVFNMIFGVALCALPQVAHVTVPDFIVHAGSPPPEVADYRDHAMRLVAEHGAANFFSPTVSHAIGLACAIVFGLLLLSAVNTAILAVVSVQYALGQDGELPRPTTRLNYSGVPSVALVVGCIGSALLIAAVRSDVGLLAELYALGVVGAIATNLVACALNRTLPISRGERAGLWVIGGFMVAAEVTMILVSSPLATGFVVGMIVLVLASRAFARRSAARRADKHLDTPELGWLAELRSAPTAIDPGRPKIMLAARGRGQAEFAVDLARSRHATLFAIYVRTLRVLDMRPGSVPKVENDPEAQASLGTVAMLARKAGVPLVPIYVESPNIAEEILDYTVTYGCDTLILGKSRRRLFARRLEGDVISEIAQHLPEGVSLLTRDATAG
ncbi:MAG: amino acid permease [Phycisphaerales bacterium]